MANLRKTLAVVACIFTAGQSAEAAAAASACAERVASMLSDGVAASRASVTEISCDEFEGTLPEDLWKLTALGTIRINSRTVVGTIPGSWSKLSALRTIDLAHCSLTGNVPASFSTMELEKIDVSDNSLSGRFPNQLLASAIPTVLLLPNDFQGSVGSHSRTVANGIPATLELLLGPGNNKCENNNNNNGGTCSSGMCRKTCCLTVPATAAADSICNECDSDGKCVLSDTIPTSTPGDDTNNDDNSNAGVIFGSLGALASVASAAACCISKKAKVSEKGMLANRNNSKFTTQFTSDSKRSQIPTRQWNGRTGISSKNQSRNEFERVAPTYGGAPEETIVAVEWAVEHSREPGRQGEPPYEVGPIVELPRVPPVWRDASIRNSGLSQVSQVSLSDALREWKQQQKGRSAFASIDGVDTTRGKSSRLLDMRGSSSRLFGGTSFGK